MKTDARVRYTRARIRDAFLQCLKEKPVNRITVKEVCERAEINRATFYAHYTDVYDLLEKLEEETLDGLRRFIANRSDKDSDLLPAILKGMAGPQSDSAVLASPNGDPGFAGKLTELFHQEFICRMSSQLPTASRETREQVYRFLAGGCSNLISGWVKGGMTIPAEEMGETLRRLSGAFLRACAGEAAS